MKKLKRIIRLIFNRVKVSMIKKSSYYFFDQRINSENLLIIVAGYQELFWDNLFNRVECFTPKDCDVVIVNPGHSRRAQLLKYAEKYKFSLISTYNSIGLAQNIAINLHAKATNIVKIDEDIVLSKEYFEKFKAAYELSQKSIYKPGFIAPLINVNGHTYYYFLKSLDELEDYESKFEISKSSCMSIMAHNNPDAAEFLWQKSIPFDLVSDKISFKNKSKLTVCPHRFSVGAIFFKRTFFEEMGGFRIGINGQLGLEEVQMSD